MPEFHSNISKIFSLLSHRWSVQQKILSTKLSLVTFKPVGKNYLRIADQHFLYQPSAHELKWQNFLLQEQKTRVVARIPDGPCLSYRQNFAWQRTFYHFKDLKCLCSFLKELKKNRDFFLCCQHAYNKEKSKVGHKEQSQQFLC